MVGGEPTHARGQPRRARPGPERPMTRCPWRHARLRRHARAVAGGFGFGFGFGCRAVRLRPRLRVGEWSGPREAACSRLAWSWVCRARWDAARAAVGPGGVPRHTEPTADGSAPTPPAARRRPVRRLAGPTPTEPPRAGRRRPGAVRASRRAEPDVEPDAGRVGERGAGRRMSDVLPEAGSRRPTAFAGCATGSGTGAGSRTRLRKPGISRTRSARRSAPRRGR